MAQAAVVEAPAPQGERDARGYATTQQVQGMVRLMERDQAWDVVKEAYDHGIKHGQGRFLAATVEYEGHLFHARDFLPKDGDKGTCPHCSGMKFDGGQMVVKHFYGCLARELEN